MTVCRKGLVRRIGALTFAVAVSQGLVSPAWAYSQKVEQYCKDDYFRLCPSYPLYSASLRLCMESKHKQMSRTCVNALIESGEVDRRRLKR